MPLDEKARQLLPTFFADRWSPIVRMTGQPTDPDAAVAAVKELLVLCGYPPQLVVEWVASPRVANGRLPSPSLEVVASYQQTITTVMRRGYDNSQLMSLLNRLNPEFGLLGHWMALHHEFGSVGRQGVVSALSQWGVVADFADIIGLPGFEIARSLRSIALQARFWWASNSLRKVVMVEHPERIVRNNAGEISNADGPAIVYRDGTEVWVWRNQPTIRRWFDLKTVDEIMAAGMPSAAVEIYGLERFVRDVPSNRRDLLDASEWGKLWQIALPARVDQNDGRAGWRLFVEVQNSTPPHATHMIPVDPYLRGMKNGHTAAYDGERPKTALEAIASTFGLSGSEYQRIVAS